MENDWLKGLVKALVAANAWVPVIIDTGPTYRFVCFSADFCDGRSFWFELSCACCRVCRENEPKVGTLGGIRMIRRTVLAVAMLAAAATADAAVITFDLTANPADPNYSLANLTTVWDSTGNYSLSLIPVNHNSGLASTAYSIVRDLQGAGVTSGVGDSANISAASRERLRFFTPGHFFQLVCFDVNFAGAVNSSAVIYLGGQGDTSLDFAANAVDGHVATPSLQPSLFTDITSARGFRITSVSFETFEPLPTPPSSSVPEPTTAMMLGMGLFGLARVGVARARRSRKH